MLELQIVPSLCFNMKVLMGDDGGDGDGFRYVFCFEKVVCCDANLYCDFNIAWSWFFLKT